MKVVRKKRRNDGRSEVYGISASREFWEYVTRVMAETGQNRSETVVEACAAYWKAPQIVSNPTGRPKNEE